MGSLLLAATGLLNAASSFILGFIVLFKGKPKNLKTIYFSLSVGIIFYSFSYFMWNYTNDISRAMLWYKLALSGVIIISPIFIHFVFVLLGIFNRKKKILYVLYAINIVFIFLNMNSLLYHELVRKVHGIIWAKAEVGFSVYLVFWCLQCFYAFYYLIKYTLHATGQKKLQLKYVTLGTLIGFFGGANNWPIWYNLPYPPYLNGLITVYAAIIAYAILRHQLMDIKVVIKRTLLFAGLFVVIYTVFSTLAFTPKFINLVSTSMSRIIEKPNSLALQNLFVGIFVQILGLFVYFKNPKDYLNKIFGLFCFIFSIWLYGFFFLYLSKNNQEAVFWQKFLYVGVCYASVASYHFTRAFLNITNRKWILILFYTLSTFFLYLVIFTNKFLMDPFIYNWGYYPKAGPFHPIFMFYIFFESGYSLYLLYKNYVEKNKISSPETEKAKYVFFGFAIGHLVIINFFATYGITVYPNAHFYVAILFIMIAYAIVRYKLMNIDVIIKRALVFSGLFITACMIVGLFIFLSQMAVLKVIRESKFAALLPSILIIVFALRPLENFLINITDKYLFQKKYDYRELLKSFTDEVLTVLDINKIARLTVDKIINIVKVESAIFYIYDEKSDQFMLLSCKGNISKPAEITKENPIFETVSTGKICFNKQREDLSGKEFLKNSLEALNAELIIAIMLQQNKKGLIIIGPKKSGQEYTQEDIDILTSLAKTEAISISNAELLEELSKTQAEAAQKEKMAVIGTLSAGIDHEISNPLGIIYAQNKAFLDNLKDGKYGNLSKEEIYERMLGIMNTTTTQAKRIIDITQKLIQFAKPKESSKEKVNIKTEIEEVLSLLSHLFDINYLKVEKRLTPDMEISANRAQIQQIFLNLIRNATEASPRNSNILISSYTKDNKAIVVIKDNGEGIPPDRLNKIFEPFYTTKDAGTGTGLGLFIVKQLVTQNNGTIVVESELGKGSTFTLEFVPIT